MNLEACDEDGKAAHKLNSVNGTKDAIVKVQTLAESLNLLVHFQQPCCPPVGLPRLWILEAQGYLQQCR